MSVPFVFSGTDMIGKVRKSQAVLLAALVIVTISFLTMANMVQSNADHQNQKRGQDARCQRMTAMLVNCMEVQNR